ncbi:hypothetical protein NsoK4_08815 [Nitrosopumilus sp. K4]|uniref:LamG-like jellyroll fold domain-containing protein n=1 Tax=Nitrosopumilus sp. K4 TaxID=2795383 RepID=UPI001BA48FB8|nr:LamG-like jellyroll fold domain-containing protein [Nitrosopumilus sp. K4]QUC64508.1 hypothetical protein NsoK4_08815 [Nitrosopumilus sp. K4]
MNEHTIKFVNINDQISVNTNDKNNQNFGFIKIINDVDTTLERIFERTKPVINSKSKTPTITLDSLALTFINDIPNPPLIFSKQFNELKFNLIHTSIEIPTPEIMSHSNNLMELQKNPPIEESYYIFFLLVPLSGYALLRSENKKSHIFFKQTSSLLSIFLIISGAFFPPLLISQQYYGLAFAEEFSFNGIIKDSENFSIPSQNSTILPTSKIDSFNSTTVILSNSTKISAENVPPTFSSPSVYITPSNSTSTASAPSNSTSTVPPTFSSPSVYITPSNSTSTASAPSNSTSTVPPTFSSPSVYITPSNSTSTKTLDPLIIESMLSLQFNKTESEMLTNSTHTSSSLVLKDQNDFVQIENVTSTNKISSLTISAWSKPDYSKGSQEFTLISKEKSFILSINNNIVPNHIAKFGIYDGIKWTFVESNVTIPEEWTHISATYDTNSIEIYVNGIYQNSAKLTGIPSLSLNGKLKTTTIDSIASEKDIVIGAYVNSKTGIDNPSNQFSGEIDTVELFDTKLSNTQISEIYKFNKDSFLVEEELSLEEILDQIKTEQQIPNVTSNQTNGNNNTNIETIKNSVIVDTKVLATTLEQNLEKQESEIQVNPQVSLLDTSYELNENVIFDLEFYDEYDALMLEISEIESAAELLLGETDKKLNEIENLQITNNTPNPILGFLFGLEKLFPLQAAHAVQLGEIDELRIALTNAKLKLEQLKTKTLQLKTQPLDKKSVDELKNELKNTIIEIKSIINKLQNANLSAHASDFQNIIDSAEIISDIKSPEKQSDKWSNKKTELITNVFDKNGNKASLNVVYNKIRDGKFNIQFSPTVNTKPGLYKIISTFTVNGIEHTIESEFAWGLVSLNTKKSIYKPGEKADFVIVVLDAKGHPIGNANLFMTITDPQLNKIELSSDNGIKPGSEIGLYDASFTTTVSGTYGVLIHAQADGIDTDFSTTFDVASSYDFDIIRTAQSKVDPTTNPNSFDVVIDVESFVDSDSITIVETIPSILDVETDADVKTLGDRKVLTWTKYLVNDKTTVGYSYSVPFEFPNLYDLGPVEIQHGNGLSFNEARPWFVANDPAHVSSGNTPGTSCRGVAIGGNCDLTTQWTPPNTGKSRLLVVTVTANDVNGNSAPSISNVLVGTIGGTTIDIVANSVIVTSEGGNDHIAAIYYLHENSWSTTFVPGTSDDVRVTLGSGTTNSDVVVSATILSGIESTGVLVNSQTDSGSNAPATQSYTGNRASNALVMVAVDEGTGITETNTNITDIANVDGSAHTHLAGYSLTAATTATTYGWSGNSGKDSSVIVEFNDLATGSASDTISLTDSITRDVLKTFTRSTSDTISLTDSIARDVLKTFTRSTSDTVSLSDTISASIVADRSTSDTISLTDSIARDVLKTFTRSTSDTVSLSDTISASIQSSRSTSDTISLTDSIARDVLKTFTRSTSDTVSLSDTISASIQSSRSTSDTVSLSDTISASIQSSRSTSDTVSLSDTISASILTGSSTSDTVSLSDTISASIQSSRSTSDTVSLSDTISASIQSSRSTSDTVSLSDTISASILTSSSTSDTVSLSDTISASIQSSRSTSDTVSLSDTISASIQSSRSTSDTVSLSDTISASILTSSSTSDTVSLSDTISASIQSSRSTSDTVSLSDTISASILTSSSTSDTVSLSDTISASIQSSRSTSDTVSLSDTISASIQSSRSTSDTVSLSDTISSSILTGSSTSDTVSLSDTISASIQSSRSTSDTVSLSDTISASIVADRALSDTVSLSDTISASIVADRSTSDTISLTDSIARDVLRILDRSTSDTVSLSDTISASIQSSRSTSDTVSLSDTISASIDIDRALSDTVSLSDTISASIVADRSTSDTISLTDSITRDVLRILDRSTSDTVSLSDTISASIQSSRSTSDTVSLSDTISASIVADRALSDTVSLSDTISASIVADRSTSDTISLTDSIARDVLRILDRSTSDTVSLSDTISASIQSSRSTSDTVSLSDTISASIVADRALSDTVSLSDTISASIVADRSTSDTISLTDSITRDVLRILDRSTSDTVSLSDTISASIVADRALSDTVSLSDTISASIDIDRALSDTVSLSDTISASIVADRSTSDTISLTDSIARDVLKILDRSTSDTVSLSDTISASIVADRALSDTVSLSDTISASIVADRSTSDTISLTDSIARDVLKILDRSTSDTVSLSDTISASILTSSSTSDTVSLSDTISASIVADRALSDTVSLSDTISASIVADRALSDTVSLSDTISASILTSSSTSDTVSLSDTISASILTSSSTSDTVSLSDTISASIVADRALSDTVSLSDTIFIHDTIALPPKITLVSISSQSTVSGTSEPNSSIEIFANGTSIGTTAANISGIWTASISVLADGTYTITSKQTDTSSNISGLSKGVVILVDSTNPNTLISTTPDTDIINITKNKSQIITYTNHNFSLINLGQNIDEDLFLDYSANVTSGVIPAINNNFNINFHAPHADNVAEEDDGIITIASGTSFTGSSGWNGIMKLPSKTTVSIPSSTANGIATSYSETAVFEIGLGTDRIELSSPARIQFTGDAGNNFVAFYVDSSNTVTFIEEQCTSDSAAGLGANDECVIQVGGDLVIWTDHFTKFGVSKRSSVSSGGGEGPSSGGGRTGVGPSGTGGGFTGFGGILGTPLTINEVSYDKCDENIARILVSSDADKAPSVVVHTTKIGSVSAILSDNQPYEDLNKITKVDKYLYEIPIASDETFLMIIVTEDKGTLQNTVNAAIHTESCVGTTIISDIPEKEFEEISFSIPRIFDVKFQIENGTKQIAERESEFTYVDNQDITVSAIVDSQSPIKRVELRTITLGQYEDDYIAISMDTTPMTISESLYEISAVIPSFLTQDPAIKYWIHIIDEDLNEIESQHYTLGVKPVGEPDVSVELDVPSVKQSTSTIRPQVYIENTQSSSYGVVSLIIDGKTISEKSELLESGQTQVSFDWKLPTSKEITSYNIQAKVDLYGTDKITDSAVLYSHPKTESYSAYDMSSLKSHIRDGNVLAEPVLIYASDPHNGEFEFRVTAPNGQCVIGSSEECLVKDSTYSNRGGLKSIELDEQIFRVKYSGPHSPVERFSITSIDPILGDWTVGLETEEGLIPQAQAIKDLTVKVKHRINSETITVFSD